VAEAGKNIRDPCSKKRLIFVYGIRMLKVEEVERVLHLYLTSGPGDIWPRLGEDLKATQR